MCTLFPFFSFITVMSLPYGNTSTKEEPDFNSIPHVTIWVMHKQELRKHDLIITFVVGRTTKSSLKSFLWSWVYKDKCKHTMEGLIYLPRMQWYSHLFQVKNCVTSKSRGIVFLELYPHESRGINWPTWTASLLKREQQQSVLSSISRDLSPLIKFLAKLRKHKISKKNFYEI